MLGNAQSQLRHCSASFCSAARLGTNHVLGSCSVKVLGVKVQKEDGKERILGGFVSLFDDFPLVGEGR